MRKYFIVAFLAAVAGLTGLAIGIAAARAHHVIAAAPAHSQSAAAASAGRSSQDGASADSETARVIRFASNPMAAPPFLVNDLDGNIISTAEWRGKAVLLNFWATWCPPCREEIPELISLENRYKDRVQIVGVSMDDAPPEEVREFARKAGINYPIVMGSRDIAAEYGGVPALPTTFILNTDGRVVQKHVGLFPAYVYEGEVRALLGLPVNATVGTFEDTGQIFLKNASRATELPGVSFKGLTPGQKQAALKRMNSETCDCGCALTIAQCRINDTSCTVSKQLAAKIVKEVTADSPAPGVSTVNQ